MLLLEFWPYGLKEAGESDGSFVSFLRDRGFSLTLPKGESLAERQMLIENPRDPAGYFNVFAQREQQQPFVRTSDDFGVPR